METAESPPPVLTCLTRLNAGGPARQVVWLLRGLAARGYRTRLVVGRVQDEEDDLSPLAREAGLDLAEVADLGRQLSPAADLRALRAVGREIVRFGPAVVHTHTAKAGLAGRLAARLLVGDARAAGPRPRTVHTFHGHVLEGYFPFPAQVAVRWLERRLGRWASDAVIVLSPRQRRDIVERFRVAPEGRVFVVPLGLDLAPFAGEPPGPPLRAELGIPDTAYVVGIVGRLAPVKDHALFLDSAAALSRRLPGARFVVVGGGGLASELRERAARLGLSGTAHFLGLRTDLARVYAGLDVVALTSRQEGTPLALLEAMAAGRPVVAAAVGGVPDILLEEWSGPVTARTFRRSDRPRGVLVEERDPEAFAAALEALAREPSRRHQLVEAGRWYVRRFHTVDRLVDDVTQVYDRVLGRAGGRQGPDVRSGPG